MSWWLDEWVSVWVSEGIHVLQLSSCCYHVTHIMLLPYYPTTIYQASSTATLSMWTISWTDWCWQTMQSVRLTVLICRQIYGDSLLSVPFSTGKGAIQLGSSVATTIEQVAYMLVAMANHVLNSSFYSLSPSSSLSSSSSFNALVVCFNAEAKEGDRGRVAVLDKVMMMMMRAQNES